MNLGERRPRHKQFQSHSSGLRYDGQLLSHPLASVIPERDATGLFDSVPIEERPTFHELIALGAHLRLESGWTESQIQRLKGHTSVQMTKVYLEGHSWTKVEIPGVK